MKTMKKVSALVLVLVMALSILAGCGGGNSDEDAIKNVVSQLQKSINDKNMDAMFNCFDPDSAEQLNTYLDTAESLGLSKEDLAEEMFSAFGADTKSITMKVEKVTIDGDTATASVTMTAADTEPSTDDLPFMKVDGKWYLDGSSSGII